MRKTILPLGALCLGLALSAGAFAAASRNAAHKNPVIDVSGLSRPGLWQNTSTITVAGQTHTSTDTQCVTEAQLEDVLNNSGSDVMPTVTDYSLHGNHLHLTGTMGQASFDRDITFDDRDHRHGSTTVKSPSGRILEGKSTGQRVGPCKSGGSDSH